MAYITITAGGEEIDRLELDGDLIVGRSPECSVPIRDVLLSRRHCRIEKRSGQWCVSDLKSKNGTRVNWQKVATHRLCDGDVLRVGRTLLTFRSGEFVPSDAPRPNRHRLVRPADPFEALAGTVVGFVLDDPRTVEGGIPQSPGMRPASPLEDTLLRPVDEPDWALNLPDEPAASMSATHRSAQARWSPPSPRPRHEPGRPDHRMTDLALQAIPQLDLPPLHLSRLARMSDTSLFMTIFVIVSILVTASIVLLMAALTM